MKAMHIYKLMKRLQKYISVVNHVRLTDSVYKNAIPKSLHKVAWLITLPNALTILCMEIVEEL